ncbi:sodium:dicarboxylate symporter [Mycolicibacterium mageritense DSM 44476 = CIP 104973]|uniref:C4-dicarboxylate transport protein 2 n=1 Tax=Mycolicibacterium mageritense TaxID=53462 RepID=A0AAI8U2C8_MYCME|nr:C4-dicarboxylate transporter DctA [Mycolicibacterium mageritense]MBN3453830.1 C4-dicarboxylate transporter DctA [Mycobacterium sp. DSM 3803]MCC9181178.1 C4-dicarboxylate transporter DctA [Mycolicibacterium mageritense]CDO27008.1 sodium:dicarboxylate symporter [Mycolicibacterium mageritense DSM 44476 = CIP 104973]BBX38258.1 C4-dicarboxylate transporter DctA [Mycolicibacterium mageritense]BDY32902.1 C4-dicarboxylate transport protein 2 [Mycolicibacterium mageritense]
MSATTAIDPPDSELVRLANKPPWYTSLFVQLLVAIVAGIAVGWLWPDVGGSLKPLADGFIKLIKMLIAPIIFCTVVLGIAHVGDLKSVGRIGVKALIYFEAVTTFALLFGLLVGNLVKPGAGFSIDPQTLASGAEAVAKKTNDGELPHTVEFLLGIIPSSVISAFAENALLQVLFFAVLFGLALAKFGEHGPPVVMEFIDHLSHIFFTIIGWIMRLAPIGAFGAMAYIIGQYGIGSLGSYGKLIAACYAAALLFIVILAAIARLFAGVNLWKFLVYIKDEMFLALGTASTEVVLPRIMAKLTNAGCSRTTTGLVVPTGYSFNLDGATLYLSICVLFLAQALGVDLSLGEQITAVLVLMLTSKGMAGVPGSSFLALSATVAAIGHGAIPVAAVALLLGADRIMDSMRVSVNLLGNCVATLVVANWEGQLDKERMRKVLDGEAVPPLEDPDPMAAEDEFDVASRG